MNGPAARFLVLTALTAALVAGCAHRSALGYWESMVVLTEAFDADADATVTVAEAKLSKNLRKTLDTNGDGLIVQAELWAHQEKRSARPYSGPRDLSGMSGHREGGFPLNVDPEIRAVDEVELGDDDLVMGIVIGGQARAYPPGTIEWE